MKRLEVVAMLAKVKEARKAWALAQTAHNADVNTIMRRLLHEAAHCYMSAEEVARASGFTVKRVRQMMRDFGLNPRDGKNLLNAKAAEALATNAELLGIEPYEMDLMSPLAYLPMGEEMKRSLQEKTVSKVTELGGTDICGDVLPDEVSGNPVIDELTDMADQIEDHHDLYHDDRTDNCFDVTKRIRNRIAALEQA